MIVFENEFIKIDILEKYYRFVWMKSTRNMEEGDFKKAMLAHLSMVLKYSPTKILVDVREMYFLILPELQLWADENVLAKTLEAGLIRDAFLVSDDLIAQISVDQTMSLEAGNKKQIRYFSDEKLALDWLLA